MKEMTKEEANNIKKHLLGQLDNFPEEKREQIEKQIRAMTTEQIQEFVNDNELIHLGGQCIFCSIVAGHTQSFIVGSNPHNIAILEINPLNRAHVLIVPKDHLEKTPPSSEDLAKEIGRKIREKLSPKNIKLNRKQVMGHSILEVIPIYGDEKMKRYQASEKELKEVQKILSEPKAAPIIKQPAEKINLPKIPLRIP